MISSREIQVCRLAVRTVPASTPVCGMALGATRGAVLRQVMERGMGPTVLGVGIGLAGAMAISIGLKSVITDTRSADPVAYLGAALLLAVVAALACFFPGLKATRIDPAITLRTE